MNTLPPITHTWSKYQKATNYNWDPKFYSVLTKRNNPDLFRKKNSQSWKKGLMTIRDLQTTKKGKKLKTEWRFGTKTITRKAHRPAMSWSYAIKKKKVKKNAVKEKKKLKNNVFYDSNKKKPLKNNADNKKKVKNNATTIYFQYHSQIPVTTELHSREEKILVLQLVLKVIHNFVDVNMTFQEIITNFRKSWFPRRFYW